MRIRPAVSPANSAGSIVELTVYDNHEMAIIHSQLHNASRTVSSFIRHRPDMSICPYLFEKTLLKPSE